jgi:protein-disulfide isomerase/uncharacterized membrane protein
MTKNSEALRGSPPNPVFLSLLTALPAIGLGLSVWLTRTFYALREGSGGFHSACNFGEKLNCDAVALSSYAELIPGLPLSSLSAGYFLGILGVSMALWVADWRKSALQVLALLSGVGSLVSLGYLAVMLLVLRNFCAFCFGIDLMHLGSLALLLMLRKHWLPWRPLESGTAKGLLLAGAGAVLIGTLAMKGTFAPASETGDIPIDEIVASVESTPPAVIQVPNTLPILGDPTAPVTLVEFSDFQCPFCKKGAQILDALLKRFPGKLRVVFRNYPLDPRCNPKMQGGGHNAACDAAKAVVCAQAQGKFAPVYETLFENQDSLKATPPAEVAAAVPGLDANALKTCMAGTETQTRIAADLEEGERLGIQSTPTFFLNGRKIEGAYPFPVWIKLIERELVRVSASSAR